MLIYAISDNIFFGTLGVVSMNNSRTAPDISRGFLFCKKGANKGQ
nr:MAG TPA: hypothetical protein [Caudoviricetes sp.]